VVSFQLTHTNPKENRNSVTTRSGIVVGKGICDNLVVEVVRKYENVEEKMSVRRKKKK